MTFLMRRLKGCISLVLMATKSFLTFVASVSCAFLFMI